MADDRLSDDEIARVLRRAADLDTADHGGGLPVAALEAAAAEVGLSPAAVRHAVAELRAGALDGEGDGADARALIVCARVVPGDRAASVEAVSRWLKSQALVRARDRGTEQVWRPREDWVASVLRAFDWAAAMRLKGVDEVIVRAVDVEGGTLIRVSARLTRPLSAAPKLGGGIAAVAGAVAGAAAGVPVEVGYAVDAALVAAGTAGGGVAGWRLGRGALGRRRARIAEAIDGVLDELERGRQPSGSAIERLAARARRVHPGDPRYRL